MSEKEQELHKKVAMMTQKYLVKQSECNSLHEALRVAQDKIDTMLLGQEHFIACLCEMNKDNSFRITKAIMESPKPGVVKRETEDQTEDVIFTYIPEEEEGEDGA